MSGAGETPLVTIGMSVFNAAATLDAALKSILWQTYANWELIVIDDGSMDDTAQILSRYRDARITVISDGSNLGLSVRLNQALSIGRGTYFARMDADDISFPDRLQKQVDYLRVNPDVDLLGCRTLVFNRRWEAVGLFRSKQTHAEICANPWRGIPLPHPSWMGKMSWFRKHGYSVTQIKAQDQELLLRSYAHSVFACHPEVCLAYRQETSSLTKAWWGRWYFVKALVEHGVRRRLLWRLLLTLSSQCIKAVLETVSLVAGKTALLQRNRFAPIGDLEKQAWRLVRGRLQRESSDMICVE